MEFCAILGAGGTSETAVLIAVIGAVASVLVAVVTAIWTGHQQEAKLRAELRTEFMAEEAIRELLLHEKWRRRSFGIIKERVGGFEDDDLRQLLVRAGAIRRGDASNDNEFWGLRERNPEWLD